MSLPFRLFVTFSLKELVAELIDYHHNTLTMAFGLHVPMHTVLVGKLLSSQCDSTMSIHEHNCDTCDCAMFDTQGTVSVHCQNLTVVVFLHKIVDEN